MQSIEAVTNWLKSTFKKKKKLILLCMKVLSVYTFESTGSDSAVF